MINVQKLKSDHAHFVERQRRIIDAEADDAGKAGVLYAHENPGYKNQTGTLTEATQYKVVRVSGRITRVKLYNRTKYAAAIDKGSKAHDIPARKAPYLVFYWHKMSRWVRTKSVRHPGTKPYRFLSNANLYAFQDLKTNLERKLSELARKF